MRKRVKQHIYVANSKFFFRPLKRTQNGNDLLKKFQQTVRVARHDVVPLQMTNNLILRGVNKVIKPKRAFNVA